MKSRSCKKVGGEMHAGWKVCRRLLGWKVNVLVTQSCLTLCDPMDCSPWCSSVRGILQAGRLEWVACHSLLQGIFLIQGSNPVSCIAGRFFTIWAAREEEPEVDDLTAKENVVWEDMGSVFFKIVRFYLSEIESLFLFECGGRVG